MKDLGTTNKLLLVIVVALSFYLLKVLSFIFVPLVFSMFIALLFLPLMRWLRNKGVHRVLSIFISLLVFAGVIFLSVEIIALTSREIRNADPEFFVKAKEKRQSGQNSLAPLKGEALDLHKQHYSNLSSIRITQGAHEAFERAVETGDEQAGRDRVQKLRENDKVKQIVQSKKQEKMLFVAFYLLLNLAEDVSVEKKNVK